MTLPRFLPAALLATAFAAPALAEDVTYQLVNGTGLTLMYFYTSPMNVSSWGADMLGTEVLGPGEAGTVLIADGSDQCDYDLRFVFDDGQEVYDSVNICQVASYTLTQ